MKNRKITDFFLPQGSKRRSYSDLILLGFRTLSNEGWRSAWWKARYYLGQSSSLNNRKINVEKINLPEAILEEITEVIEAKVSVVIPTKNGGNDFEYVLNKIKNQKGIKDIELIVVDSGSTDETLAIATKYGAKLYQIKPEEFGHGKTRNFGAEKATGDYILFATQDAMFAGQNLVYNMVKVLEKDEKIAAVTCRQIPRSDADLMAGFQVWNHYTKFLELNEDKIISTPDLNISPVEKRKIANLSDSCCCINRDLFLKYLFRINFAEDLDLGLRLLSDGYKLAYLHSNAIIHSHNRPASYFFKASYTDSKVVSRIIGNRPFQWEIKEMGIFYASIKKLYNKLIPAISIIESQSQTDPKKMLQELKSLLYSEATMKERSTDLSGEPTINRLFDEIDGKIGNNDKYVSDEKIYNFLLNNYIGTLQIFGEYCSNYANITPIKQDFISTLYKLFANSSGAALGNLVLFLNNEKLSEDKIKIIDEFLSGGV